MAVCRRCNRTTDTITLDRYGLCSSCSEKLHTLLGECTRLIVPLDSMQAATSDSDTLARQYEHAISRLRQLLPYENIDIPTLNTPASELILKYSRIHDSVLDGQHAQNARSALAEAGKTLEPFCNMYTIRRALDAITDAKRHLQDFPRKRIMAVINQKGGVGKTTAAINIGAGLARKDMNVLLIDLDPQANLTDAMGIHDEEIAFSVYDVLNGDIALEEAVVYRNGMSVLPASVLLARADKEFSGRPAAYELLKNALAQAPDYDYVFVDCLPSLGILTLNALMAANEIIVPVLPEYFALTGVRKLLDAMEFIKEQGNHDIFVSTVLFNRYDPRKGHHREVAEKLRDFLGDSVRYLPIRDSIALAEAASCGIPIFRYRPRSNGTRDYRDICETIHATDDPHAINI